MNRLLILLLILVSVADGQTIRRRIPPATAASPTLVSDAFSGSGALDANWTTINGTLSQGSGVLNTTGALAADQMAYYSGATFAANQFSRDTLGTLTSGFGYCDLLVRWTSGTGTGNFYYFCTDGASGSGHSEVWKYVNGSGTKLADIAATFVDTDVVEMRVTGSSTTTIKIYKNGSQAGSDVTDSSSPFTSGKPGMGLYTYDHLVRANIRGWVGGDL